MTPKLTPPGPPGLTVPDEYEGLCGEWMPRARTWCGRKDGHPEYKPHMTIPAVRKEKAGTDQRNARKYPARMQNRQAREGEKTYAADKYARRLAMLACIKQIAGCADCGFDEFPEALEFDHVLGEKIKEVSRLARGGLKALFEEIAKCEVVCANCHRRRTSSRNQWGRGVPRAERKQV